MAITRNKNEQTEIKVSWGKVESTYDSEELIFPPRLSYYIHRQRIQETTLWCHKNRTVM